MFQYRRRNSCSTDAQYVTSNKFHCNNISLILTCYFLVVVFRLPSTVMLLLFAVIVDLMVSDVVDCRWRNHRNWVIRRFKIQTDKCQNNMDGNTAKIGEPQMQLLQMLKKAWINSCWRKRFRCTCCIGLICFLSIWLQVVVHCRHKS